MTEVVMPVAMTEIVMSVAMTGIVVPVAMRNSCGLHASSLRGMKVAKSVSSMKRNNTHSPYHGGGSGDGDDDSVVII